MKKIKLNNIEKRLLDMRELSLINGGDNMHRGGCSCSNVSKGGISTHDEALSNYDKGIIPEKDKPDIMVLPLL